MILPCVGKRITIILLLDNTDSDTVHMPEKRVVESNDPLDVRRVKVRALIDQVITFWKGKHPFYSPLHHYTK